MGFQEKLVLTRNCGRTVSRDLAELMCSVSTLTTVQIGVQFRSLRLREVFFSVLAEQGQNSRASDHIFCIITTA